jgi:hypothetical protein
MCFCRAPQASIPDDAEDIGHPVCGLFDLLPRRRLSRPHHQEAEHHLIARNGFQLALRIGVMAAALEYRNGVALISRHRSR